MTTTPSTTANSSPSALRAGCSHASSTPSTWSRSSSSVVLFITNAAVIQSAGPRAFGWWIIGFLAFLIPGAIVTGQLGRMFPGEGSIYLWTQKAFGSFWGFFAGFCAWWPGVLVMVATGTVVLSYLSYVFPSTIGATSVQVQGLIIIGFIVLSAVLANQRFRLTQNIVNVVCVLYALAIGAGVRRRRRAPGQRRACRDRPHRLGRRGPRPPTPGSTSPTGVSSVWSCSHCLGVEVPLNMGVEIKDERSITRYLVWGSLAVMLAYLLATWAVMVTVPATDGESAQVTALATAVGAALTGWLGKLVAILLAAFFLFITVVYNFSFARLVFVSGLDQKLPAAMAKVEQAQGAQQRGLGADGHRSHCSRWRPSSCCRRSVSAAVRRSTSRPRSTTCFRPR